MSIWVQLPWSDASEGHSVELCAVDPELVDDREDRPGEQAGAARSHSGRKIRVAPVLRPLPLASNDHPGYCGKDGDHSHA